MPKKEKKTATKTSKKPAAKKPAAATKKAAPKKKSAPVKKSATRKPAAARPRASAATPPRLITRRAGGQTQVVGMIGTVTNEAIALKAYYLAERRRHLGLPGDPESDWLEAERLLRG